MSKLTLLNSRYAKASGLSEQARKALMYLIKYQSLVLVPEQVNEIIKNVRIFVRTPITDMFQRVIDTDKLNQFSVLNYTQMGLNLPELLTYDEITVDGKSIPDTSVPDVYRRPWINITPLLGGRGTYNGIPSISDVPGLCNLFSRAVLCASYDDAETWLNPKLSAFVVESYSMTIASLLRQTYNLAYDEEKFVQTIFAAYMAQKLAAPGDPLDTPPLLYRCAFLGTMNEILERMSLIREYRENDGNSELTPAIVAELISKTGPARMKNFNAAALYRYFTIGSVGSMSMLIAMDYPPYWVYQLIKSASGAKNPIITNVIKQTGYKQKIMQFATELNVSGGLVEKLKR